MATELKRVVCVGIGGGAMFYISKYLHYLGVSIEGFDIDKNVHTDELEDLDIKISFHNPEGPLSTDTDLIIYSNALPNGVIKKIAEENAGLEMISVDKFYEDLLDALDNKRLSESEIAAVRKADVAPLYDIDLSGVVLIGVTGTDGKTTTTEMISSVLEHAGYKFGLINTVSARIGDKEKDTGFHVTTPSAQENAGYIKEMIAEGCTHIILECTSHGLKTGRLAGLNFDLVAFTNITSEHLDFHGTLEGLVSAKALLITKHLKPEGWAVVNLDDENVKSGIVDLARNQVRYSKETSTDLFAQNIDTHEDGISFEVHGVKDLSVNIPMIGEYNVSNALAAIGVCLKLGIEESVVEEGLSGLAQVPGRTQVLQKNPFMVIVDFAHTPNGLENVLRSVKTLSKGKLIAVFGCAGKRDPRKRSKMGEVAGKYADVTILTAEDPRSEKLSDINDEIEGGWNVTRSVGQELVRFDDDTRNVKVREDAIRKAIDIAKEGDIVIVCGKSHEKSLCFGNTEYLWNDIEFTKGVLGN